MKFILLALCLAKYLQATPYDVRGYNATSPIEFQKIGELSPVKEEFVIKLSLNLQQLMKDGHKVLTTATNEMQQCATNGCREKFHAAVEHVAGAAYLLGDLMHANSRHKREAWFPSFGDFLKTSGGVMNDEDRQMFSLRITKLRDKQNEIIYQTNDMKSTISEMFSELSGAVESIKEITAAANKLSQHINQITKDLDLEATLEEAAETFRKAVEIVFTIVSTGKIQGQLLSVQQMDELFARVKREQSDIPFNNIIEIITQQQSRPLIDGYTLKVTITIPTVNAERYDLYHVTSTPVATQKSITILKTPIKNLVVGIKQITSLDDTRKCMKSSNGTFICKPVTALVTEEADTCVSRLFRRRSTELCGKEMVHARLKVPLIMRQTSSQLIVITPANVSIAIRCGKTDTVEVIHRHSSIKFHAPCKIDVMGSSYIMTPTFEVEEIAERNINIKTPELRDLESLPAIKLTHLTDMETLKKHLEDLKQQQIVETQEELFRGNNQTWWATLASFGSSILFIIIALGCICICIKV